MKPMIPFDREFPARLRRGYWPIRSIGQLMIVVALSGLVLSIVANQSRDSSPATGAAPRRWKTSKLVHNGPWSLVQGPNQTRQGQWREAAQPQPPPDRFVITARAEIDPGMVVQARADIDTDMVFNPYTQQRGLAPSGPQPNVLWSLPGQAPSPAPVPDQPAPPGGAPRRP